MTPNLQDTDMNHRHDESKQPPFNTNWIWLGFILVAGFFLLTEHRAHLLGWLPWLILLACPLLHIFMHGGHGAHRDDAAGRHQHEEKPGSEK